MSGRIFLSWGDSSNNAFTWSRDNAIRDCLRTLAEIKRVRETITKGPVDTGSFRSRESVNRRTSGFARTYSGGTLDVLNSYSDYAGQYTDNTGEHQYPEGNGRYPRIRNTVTGDDPAEITREITKVTPELLSKATQLRKTLEEIRAERLKYIIEERARRGND